MAPSEPPPPGQADTPPHATRRRVGTSRRRFLILGELLAVAAVCITGFAVFSPVVQRAEAHAVAAIVRYGLQTTRVSAVTAPQILMFPPHAPLLAATVTPSCSSLLSILGLAALSFAILRRRHGHALLAFVVAAVLVTVANDLRMAAAIALGLEFGKFWLVAFHSWAGTLWNFAATLGGFLVMLYIALPSSVRAEQDRSGRHTAGRPDGWKTPGLGYSAEAVEQRRQSTRTLTAFFYRRILPKPIGRRMARRREAGRIDYRIGHLTAEQRIDAVRALAADGLSVHTASLLAVATYDEDPAVLDALAAAVASRQWEPVITQRVAALRLWARGWLTNRPGAGIPSAVIPARDQSATDTAGSPTPPAASAPQATPDSDTGMVRLEDLLAAAGITDFA